MYFVGIANAIDLADRFLPRLQALNCELQVEVDFSLVLLD